MQSVEKSTKIAWPNWMTKMSRYTQYGPGDMETWGKFDGHPLDPRNNNLRFEEDTEDEDVEYHEEDET